MKELAALTQDEIRFLYPVEIFAYNAQWPALFLAEQQQIAAAMGADNALRIEHFDSTAVPGLPAKDTYSCFALDKGLSVTES